MPLGCDDGDHLPDVAWLKRASIGLPLPFTHNSLPGMDGRPESAIFRDFSFLLIASRGGWQLARRDYQQTPYQAGLSPSRPFTKRVLGARAKQYRPAGRQEFR